jgi:hypothetical protein
MGVAGPQGLEPGDAGRVSLLVSLGFPTCGTMEMANGRLMFERGLI